MTFGLSPYIRRQGAVLLGLLIMTGSALPALGQSSLDKDIELLVRASKARAAIVKSVSSTVVHISVEKTVAENTGGGGLPDPFDDEFFKRFFAPRLPKSREFKQRGLGSGTIVDGRGYILTNNHVIEDADKIIVKLKDGRELNAKLIGADKATDLAVVKITGKKLPVAKLGNSDDLLVGETVMAIGNPFGLEQTVTQGIVSAKGRSSVGLTDYEDFIQTDAPINPGNSGGPMVNLRGQIVGVNTAIFSRSGGNMGIGFAIPINMAKKIMQSLIDSGRVTRGFLGVVIQDLTQELADAMGAKVKEGVLIASVGPKTPAAKGGIKQGDIITKFNGKRVRSSNELRNTVAGIKPGKTVPVELIRDGNKKTIRLRVGEQPSNMQAAIQGESDPKASGKSVEKPEEVLGLKVETLTRELADRLDYRGQKGVVVSQAEGTALEAGLRQGALIQEVNRKKVRNTNEFRTAIKKTPKGKFLLLLVRFGNATRFIGLKKP